MNFAAELIADLRTLEAAEQSLRNIPEELAMLEYQFETIEASQTDRVIVSGGFCDREAALVANIEKRETLSKNLEMTKIKVEMIKRALSTLTDTEREVIRRFFIRSERGAVYSLMDALGYERTQIYKIRNIAVKKLLRALYGEA